MHKKITWDWTQDLKTCISKNSEVFPVLPVFHINYWEIVEPRELTCLILNQEWKDNAKK